MTIDLTGLARAGRALAVQLQGDEGTITRGVAGGTTNPVNGDWTPNPASVVYSGQCRVRRPSTAQEQEIVFGDVNVTVSRYVASLPHDAPLIAVNDTFTLTATEDPEILNVPMRVAIVVGKSVLMYRQLGLEVIE